MRHLCGAMGRGAESRRNLSRWARKLPLQSAKRRGRRIPVGVLDTLECIRVEPSRFGKGFLGYARELEMCPDPLDGVVNHGDDKNTSGCEMQDANHIGMGEPYDTAEGMERTPDERREILRRFIVERKLKVARWAKASAVNSNSIYNFLNGHSQALDLLTYQKLARTAEVPVWRLNGDKPEPPSPTVVWVAGAVEAGAFREAVEWDRSLWYSVDVPIPSKFRGKARALEVRGNSMNLEYPDGSIVMWVPMLDFRSPQDGDDVIVYSHAKDGRVEATVKNYRVVDGKRWLWPRSSDPAHQAPVEISEPGHEVDRIEIEGIVIGGYRPKVL